jgi:hypothetical protein
MEFNSTIDLIIKDLEQASKIIDDLKNYPGVPLLQVELAKSKCKSAGEVIALLKNMDEKKPEITAKIISQLEEIKPPASEVKKPDEPVSYINISVAEKPENEKKQSKTARQTPPPSEKNESPVTNRENSTESTILADKFSHLSNTFNEQLAGMRSAEDVSDILKTKPLTNLYDAIGVNDKFLYIREIFDGNKESYNQAIARIEEAESMKDARAVIMSYTGTNNESETVKKLLDLVKRKFSPNE